MGFYQPYSIISIFSFPDRWGRSPVHWAVLNGHIDALVLLLDLGANVAPGKSKNARKSSIAIETPLEMARRLFPNGDSAAVNVIKFNSRNA